MRWMLASRQDFLKRCWGRAGKNKYTLYFHPVSEKTNVRERKITEVSVKHIKTSRCSSVSEKVHVFLGTDKKDYPQLQ